MKSARRWPGCIATALLGLGVGTPALGALAAHLLTVTQEGRAFSVATMHIQRGDTVRFTNSDKFDHQINVDAPNFKFESAEQPPGTAKDIQFTAAGTFDVHCEIHPRMHLAVTVD